MHSILDHVFVCNAWDSIFPRASQVAHAHTGSDHTPLVGDFVSLSRRFQFDTLWLLGEGFVPPVSSKIPSLLASDPCSYGLVDY